MIEASKPGSPTVIVYGHYDVQAPGPLDLWTSPPFEPEIRDGHIYGRGTCDDKGNFYALLRAALDLAGSGELGVNVRVLADGEEEVGGHSVMHHLADVEGEFSAAVIFDGSMVERATCRRSRPACAGSPAPRCGCGRARASCTRASTAAPRRTPSTTCTVCWRPSSTSPPASRRGSLPSRSPSGTGGRRSPRAPRSSSAAA